MKKNKNLFSGSGSSRTKREKAQAMVVAFIYISIASLMAIYMMSSANNLHKIIVREVRHSRAFYAGQSGLVRALTDLTAGRGLSDQNVAGMTVTTAASPSGNNTIINSTVTGWLP